MYTVPSAPIAGEEKTLPPVATDHRSEPVVPLIAYTEWSSQPTKTVPSAPTAGLDSTVPVVVNAHRSAPVAALSASTLYVYHTPT